MRVDIAKEIKKSARGIKVVDPHAGGPERINKLVEIEENALAFATDFILEFDFPSSPNIQFASIKGFENIQKSFDEVIGVITVLADFYSLNRHKIRMEFPIPVSRGHFYAPSVVVHKGKRYILSQALFDHILENIETMRPKLYNALTYDTSVQRVETLERPLFSAPEDPSGWSDLISERYI